MLRCLSLSSATVGGQGPLIWIRESTRNVASRVNADEFDTRPQDGRARAQPNAGVIQMKANQMPEGRPALLARSKLQGGVPRMLLNQKEGAKNGY